MVTVIEARGVPWPAGGEAAEGGGLYCEVGVGGRGLGAEAGATGAVAARGGAPTWSEQVLSASPRWLIRSSPDLHLIYT